MKVTIIYDNTTYKKNLKSDWGFSCFVEAYGQKILFDAGGNGKILLDNMQKLGIPPKTITEIFISHSHYDHTGGLSAFLNENNDVKLFAPPSFRGVKNVRELVYLDKPTKLHENIYSTGELDRFEQILIVNTDNGLVLISGCSHPKMEHILEAASQFGKIYGIIGGLHGFNQFELFENFGLICPTHCTKHIAKLKVKYPEKYIAGGAGQVIEI